MPHHTVGGHDWREDHKQDLRSYANSVVKAVQGHLSGTNVPLVVVTDERLDGMLLASSSYPFLVQLVDENDTLFSAFGMRSSYFSV